MAKDEVKKTAKDPCKGGELFRAKARVFVEGRLIEAGSAFRAPEGAIPGKQWEGPLDESAAPTREGDHGFVAEKRADGWYVINGGAPVENGGPMTEEKARKMRDKLVKEHSLANAKKLT